VRGVLLALASLGCSQSAREAFTEGRSQNRCVEVFPACGGSAGCVLADDQYLEGSFPSTRRFLVETEGPAGITVELLLTSRGSSGVDTRIFWYEPNCVDRREWASDGVDLFREAGDDRIIARTGSVTEFGEHLIEVRSDAFADYLLGVDLEAP